MITPEQKKEIRKFLLSKNLPYDLVLEVEDHMINQIEDSNEKEFVKAFDQTKKDWKKELKLVYSFRKGWLHKITIFQKKVEAKMYWQIMKNALIIFIPFVFVTSFLANSNENWFYFILHFTYYGCLAISFYVLIRHFHILKTTFNIYSKSISMFQNGAGNLFTGGFLILVYNIWLADESFNIYISAINSILNFQFSMKIIVEFLMAFAPLFLFLFGLMYFLEYKKAISQLKQRTNLKL